MKLLWTHFGIGGVPSNCVIDVEATFAGLDQPELDPPAPRDGQQPRCIERRLGRRADHHQDRHRRRRRAARHVAAAPPEAAAQDARKPVSVLHHAKVCAECL